MPTFRYKGTSFAGKTVKGKMQARSESDLYNKLKEQKVYVYESSEVKKSVGKKLSKRQLSEICRQLSSMLKSGIPVVRAVAILS